MSPSPWAGRSRFSRGHAQTVELEPVVLEVLEGEQAVSNEFELVVLVVGQIDDQDRRPALDPAYEADSAAGHGVGDEKLLSIDDVFVAVEPRFGPEGGQVGAGAGLGQGEPGEFLTAGEFGKIALFLLGGSEGSQGVDGADTTVDRGKPSHVGFDRRHSEEEP